jgi:predicted dehydrogenase
MSSDLNRRTFVKRTAAAAGLASTLVNPKAFSANERVRVGYIGVANRGGQLIKASLPHKDLEIVAICDVYKPQLEKVAGELKGKVDTYTDFRKMIDRNDIDAVVIATPDHWHAIQTVMACDSGKDVYVEKPLSVTIKEGRRMVEAARRNKRVVQVGTHRRASKTYKQLHKLVQQGELGKITIAHCYRISNMWPNGIGKETPTQPIDGLDWDMWLGPRQKQPFQTNITPYKFRWWQNYSSQVGNWGVHYFDAIRWMLDEVAPASVSAHGGKFAVDDDRTVPDTFHATYEFASGCLLVFGQYEASNYPMMQGELDLRGTKGIAFGLKEGFEIIPETGGQFVEDPPRSTALKVTDQESNSGMTEAHMRNFIDCIKSRETPDADIEEGHRSTSFAHLGNIAMAVRQRIEWDPINERITNIKEANDLLHYEYRKPWKLG